MQTKNRAAFEQVAAIVAEENSREKSKTDGLMVIAIYERKKRAEVKVLINGLDPDRADVIIREIYSKIYEIRKRKDPKAQALDKKLSGKKSRV